MRRSGKAALIAVIAVILPVLPAWDASAGLRSIRARFNRKEYAAAREMLLDELPGMKGRNAYQARLLLAALDTDVDGAASTLEEVMVGGGSREALKARLELAKIRYSTGEYRRTIDLLDGIAPEGREKERYAAVFFRALSRRQLGDLEGARRDFEKIDRGDYLHWSYIALGEIDMLSGRISEAIDRYETIAAAQSSPIAGFRLGECYEIAGEREKALQTYRSVARYFPYSPEAPKAREKVSMMESSLKRAGEETKREGGEGGKTFSNRIPDGVDSSPGYTLQFGAFSDRENARAFVSDLGSMIEGLHIEVAESGGTVWYRVRAGRYSTREEAEEAAMKVMEKTGYSSKVLPVK